MESFLKAQLLLSQEDAWEGAITLSLHMIDVLCTDRQELVVYHI